MLHAVVLGSLVLVAAGAAIAGPAFVPDGKIHADRQTNLLVCDAELSPGFRPGPTGTHGKFPVDGWTSPGQVARWQVDVPRSADYQVNLLLQCNHAAGLEATVSCQGHGEVSGHATSSQFWDRQPLSGVLHLPAGRQVLSLRARATDGASAFSASVHSIELIRPVVARRLHQAALRSRADTRWLQEARYGLMCHWTSESYPSSGPRRPYGEAAARFDVEALARQVEESGAGFLVLTTAHGEQYFPAPLKSLEAILPGRTSRRDLVADLAEALGRRGIRLMLYYHIGASGDLPWMQASGFWDTDTTRLFSGWRRIISEVGSRYGSKVAGFWFDDGFINYYYRSPDWQALTRAARTGYPQRLVAYNPWLWPSPTEFQDYCCGECFEDPGRGGQVPVGGDGRYVTGTYQGLQACATLVSEGDWVHGRADSPVGPIRWKADELARLLAEFGKRRSVPIFNLEIYQEGTVSPDSIRVFGEARRLLDTRS